MRNNLTHKRTDAKAGRAGLNTIFAPLVFHVCAPVREHRLRPHTPTPLTRARGVARLRAASDCSRPAAFRVEKLCMREPWASCKAAQGSAPDVPEIDVPVTIHAHLRPDFFVYIQRDL